MASDTVGFLARLPMRWQIVAVLCVATSIATWAIVNWLPNPTAAMLIDHVTETKSQTTILRQICANTSRSPFEAGRCMGHTLSESQGLPR